MIVVKEGVGSKGKGICICGKIGSCGGRISGGCCGSSRGGGGIDGGG